MRRFAAIRFYLQCDAHLFLFLLLNDRRRPKFRISVPVCTVLSRAVAGCYMLLHYPPHTISYQWHFRFSRRQAWRRRSSGLLCRVALTTLMTEAASTSATSMNLYQVTLRTNPYDSRLLDTFCFTHASYEEVCRKRSHKNIIQHVSALGATP
jgi:hypothetical protein